jgi:ribonuclease III
MSSLERGVESVPENWIHTFERYLSGTRISLEEINDLSLFARAFTHPSYANEIGALGYKVKDYERLEFLGDRIINLVAAEHIFRTDSLSEGDSTKRMKIVSNDILSELVEVRDPIFVELILLGNGVDFERGKGSIIANVFEAFIAAVYLDQGLERARVMAMRILFPALHDLSIDDGNPKGQLQEACHQFQLPIPDYQTENTGEAAHDPDWNSIVTIAGKVYGFGKGSSKRAAEEMAAAKAVEELKKEMD